jgi:TetR/AcrR family transcriptional repressor of nem operon
MCPPAKGRARRGRPANPETRAKLIAAAHRLVLAQGFANTTVEQVCEAAGLTKGAFFHYFPNKTALGLAAIQAWAEGAGAELAARVRADEQDPVARLFAHLDVMAALALNPDMPPGCVVGTIAQESAAGPRQLSAASAAVFERQAQAFAALIKAAKEAVAPAAEFDPAALGRHFVVVLQGAFVLAKASGERSIVADQIALYVAHLASLLGLAKIPRTPSP